MKLSRLIAIAVLTVGLSPLRSPKDQSQQPVILAVAPPTVTRIPFGWPPYVMPQAKMYLRFGAFPGNFTNMPIEVTGLTNYTLTLTNWGERKARHWYALDVPQIGQSRAIPWSRLPPNMIALTWTGSPPVTISVRRDLADSWTMLQTVWTTNYFETPIIGLSGFFTAEQRLFIRSFNPLNDQ